MRRNLCLFGVASLLLCSFFQPVSAAGPDIPGKFSGTVAFKTEYSLRGRSQSDEKPALQGNITWNHDRGVYVGVWGSNVDFNDGDQTQVEIEYFAGYNGKIDSFGWGGGAVYYTYPGADSGLDYDYFELFGSLGYDFEVLSLKGSVNYSPDFFGGNGDGIYVKLDARVPLPHDFNLNGHGGYQAIEDNATFVPDYYEGAIGLGYSWDEGLDFNLEWIETDLDKGDCAGCAGRGIFSVSMSF